MLLERASAALIRYPRFKELHRGIRECQDMSQLVDEPQCMSLEGVTGAGKSTLVRDYAAAFPRTEGEEGTQVPIFYLETPSPVTVKGMAATMLARLGDPAAHRGTLWSMNYRLIRLMIACQVELTILDDFHHLIDKDTNRILATVSDWLKVLIKETGVTFLVVGITGKVGQILDANAQLSRLFAVRETLEPFTCDPADEASIQEFARFVQYMEQVVETPLPRSLPRMELLYRLHYATDGVVGNLINLLRYAALIARRQHKDVIDLFVLDAAFHRRLSSHLKGKVNPFLVPASESFVAPAVAAAESSTPSGKRRPSVSSTLTAA
jgi:hypothetical protein